MTTNHKPTSPLPWLAGQTITAAKPDRPQGSHERVAVAQRVNRGQDAVYLTHAANHYPELIAASRKVLTIHAVLTADGIMYRDKIGAMDELRSLLRKLGEL